MAVDARVVELVAVGQQAVVAGLLAPLSCTGGVVEVGPVLWIEVGTLQCDAGDLGEGVG